VEYCVAYKRFIQEDDHLLCLENAMANQDPFIDPFEIDRIIRKAKVQRTQDLREWVAAGAGAARWGGLAALAASCFALFVSHGTAGPQGKAGGESSRTITHTG
jgi:hypothetical protein